MTKQELKECWAKTLEEVSKTLGSLRVDTYFRPLTPLKLDERSKKLYLLCIDGDSMFFQTMVSRHQEELVSAVAKTFGSSYIVELARTDAPEEEVLDVYRNEDQLNPKYTFESFVKGPNNSFALAASLAVAESFARRYNPLFIYAGSGLGKTHLMHAIGHYVHLNRPKKKVLYVSAETFTAELIDSIRNKTQTKFKEKYRTVDYLLFDDVQFLATSDAAQDELFATFDALDNANKQIVFTSDRPPKELGDIPERLRTRFGQGIPVDIQPPGYETKMAILQNKAILDNLDINDPDLNAAMNIIAKNVHDNIRELEGAFTRVISHATLIGEPVTEELAKRVLTEVFGTKSNEITPQDIKRVVASYYKVSISDLESSRKSQNIVYPRQIAIYLIRTLCPSYSYPKIGELFGGRNHTTILHSFEKISEEMRVMPDLKQTVDNITSLLGE